jgi:hypothetical protein
MPMTIVPVGSQEGLSEFIEFPWTVYAGDQAWVPPLREQVLFDVSGASAFSRYGRFQPFLCEQNGRVLGRIAALVNPRLRGRTDAVLGQLGYFECLDDPGAAAALVGAGLEWLRGQGVREVIGPMNGGAHKSHRLMTRGFDTDPFLFEPRNPPYYPALFEACGFAPVRRWYTYELTLARARDLVARYDRVLARRPPPGVIEAVPPARAQEVISRIHALLDRCWAGHVGYASLDLEEFGEVFAGGLTLMSPGNLGIATQDGRDSGFVWTFPDYVAEVRALNGHASEWGRWLGVSRPERLIMHTSALAPEARSTSAAMALVAFALRAGERGGFEQLLAAVAVEGFLSDIGDRTREYTLYGRAIS